MNPIDALLEELDGLWGHGSGAARQKLHIIGSSALFLQTDYRRGTKDGDVLESRWLGPQARDRLLALAGPGTRLHRRHGIYLDVVQRAVPLLPPEPLWHSYPLPLEHLEILVLDVVDVLVSKLKRWSATDRDDARLMIEGGHADHARMLSRVTALIDHYQFDGRSDLLPQIVERFQRAETDWFGIDASDIPLPDTIDG